MAAKADGARRERGLAERTDLALVERSRSVDNEVCRRGKVASLYLESVASVLGRRRRFFALITLSGLAPPHGPPETGWHYRKIACAPL